MSDIRIEVFDGDYSNDDVYERVLGYIAQKECVSGYGFTCSPNLSIIEQFKLSEFYSLQKYSLQGTTQGNGLTGADMPVRFSM